ncbi:MAG: hypothetical protein ACK4PI_03380 [Tepidisphaerales bacterium]
MKPVDALETVGDKRVDALAKVFARLAELVRTDHVLRQELLRLLSATDGSTPSSELSLTAGESVQGVSGRVTTTDGKRADAGVSAVAGETAAPAVPAGSKPAAPPPPPPDRISPEEARKLLDIGSQAPREVPDYKSYVPSAADKAIPVVRDEELGNVAARSRLKARACRWVVERRRRQQAGEDFSELHEAEQLLKAEAHRMPSCKLWMLHPDAPSPVNTLAWELVAGSFDALAAAAELNLRVQKLEAESYFKIARTLLAEANSALRVAVASLGYDQPDPDQDRSFLWLRRVTKEDQILVERFMTLKDPGDPTKWDDMIDRIKACLDEVDATAGLDHDRQQVLNNLSYQVRKLKDASPDDIRPLWDKVVELVTTLVGRLEVPPSNVEVRNRLLEVIDQIPDDLTITPEFERVLESIDQYLADRETVESEAPEVTETAEVRRLRALLAGKAAVLIGGVRRPHNAQRLEQAFGLSRLDWITTREHESISSFEPYVAKDDVAVVLLAIRWSSHSFEGVKEFCEKYDKPYVRLPGGYGVDQVAYQVLRQVGEQLQDRFPTTDNA